MSSPMHDNGQAVRNVARVLTDNTVRELEHLPELLIDIVAHERWLEFERPNGEVQTYRPGEFHRFASTPPTRGLGTSVEFLQRVCHDNPVALDALDRVTARGRIVARDEAGRVRSLDSNDPTPQENTAQGSIRKLRKAAPELHERVLAGELTPNAAMVEAGFRRPRRSLYIDDPTDAARLLAGWFGPRLGDLLAALAEYIEVEA